MEVNMLITQIITVIFAIVSPIFFGIVRSKRGLPSGELCVLMPNINFAGGIIFDAFGILLISLSMHYSLTDGKMSHQLITYIFGILLVLASLVVFAEWLQAVVLIGDEVIVKGLFKTKIIPVSNIDEISCSKGIIHFYKKDASGLKRRLFDISAGASGAAELVHTIENINEKRTPNSTDMD